MTTTTVDLPAILYQYIETEVENGRYKSKAEAIRPMVRKEMENRHSTDEQLSDETLDRIREARSRGNVEGDIRELIEDTV